MLDELVDERAGISTFSFLYSSTSDTGFSHDVVKLKFVKYSLIIAYMSMLFEAFMVFCMICFL